MNSFNKGVLFALLGCFGVLVLSGIAGVILMAMIAIPNYQNARERAIIARSMSDLRMLETGLEMFFLDNQQYPVMHADPDWLDEHYPNVADANSIASMNNAFVAVGDTNQRRINLTTPIAYLGALPSDPFRATPAGYGYASDGQSYFILTAWGPDRVDGIGGPNGEFLEMEYTGAPFGSPTAAFRGAAMPINDYHYDPSNGLDSVGDVMRIGRIRRAQ